MKPVSIALGPYMTNSYIIQDGDCIAIVDAPYPADRLIEAMKAEGIVPDEVLLTHAHHDHVFGLEMIRKAFPDIRIYVSADDMPYLDDNGKLLRKMVMSFDPSFGRETESITIPSDILGYSSYSGSFTVMATPGHTAGSVSLYSEAEGLVLTGDTLFQGGVGRTDLGGDYSELMRSLEKLAGLPDSTIVLPGHGGLSTIGTEKKANPYMMR